MQTTKEAQGRLRLFQVLSLLFLVVLLLGGTWLLSAYYTDAYRARIALSNAKVVRLAVWSVSTAYQANDLPLTDNTTPSGFSASAEQQIQTLSEMTGTVYLKQLNETGDEVQVLHYVEGDYLVEYQKTEGQDRWSVYKTVSVITP